MNNLKKLCGDGIDPQGLVEEMRQLGIRQVGWGDVYITLSDSIPSIPVPSQFEDEGKKEMCSCEHPITEHNDLLQCLHGCEDVVCGREVT